MKMDKKIFYYLLKKDINSYTYLHGFVFLWTKIKKRKNGDNNVIIIITITITTIVL
jgi:hypothetical protein